MDVKDIIDTLRTAPRFGRPEAVKTLVITDALAKEIVKALNATKIKYKGSKHIDHENRVHGASPQ
jgi:hypothetical protein